MTEAGRDAWPCLRSFRSMQSTWTLCGRSRSERARGRRFHQATSRSSGTSRPIGFDDYPRLKLPATVRYPAGFSVSGASVGTFLRSALLIAGQKALGRRCGRGRVLRARGKGSGLRHHAVAFPQWISEGRALLRAVHACSDSCARCRRDSVLRLQRAVPGGYAFCSPAQMAVCQRRRSSNGGLGFG